MKDGVKIKIIGEEENLKNRSVGQLADGHLMKLYFLLKEAYPKCKGFSAILREEETDDGVDVHAIIGLVGDKSGGIE